MIEAVQIAGATGAGTVSQSATEPRRWRLGEHSAKDVVVSSEALAIGDAIRRARIAAGYSQESLAHLAGIELSTLGRYERGEREIDAVTYEKLIRVLAPHLAPLREVVPNFKRVRFAPEHLMSREELKSLISASVGFYFGDGAERKLSALFAEDEPA